MTRTIQSRQNSKNEVETTSKIQPVVSDSVSKVAPKSVIYKPIAHIQESNIIRKKSNLLGLDVFEKIQKDLDLFRSTKTGKGNGWS